MITVLYREGDVFTTTTLDEFSKEFIARKIEFDPDVADADSPEDLTTEHFPDLNTTVVAYFNSDGESRNWIGPMSEYVIRK